MRAFLKYLARGVLLCAGLLVLSLSVCLAAGLFWIPEAGESDAEIPKVYVIEPKEEEQAGGETQTAENTAEQGTESPAAGKTEGGEGTAASAGADAGADSRTDSGAGPVDVYKRQLLWNTSQKCIMTWRLSCCATRSWC